MNTDLNTFLSVWAEDPGRGVRMMQLAIAGFLVGAVFGLRFKVFLLIPAILVSSVMITLAEIIAHQTPGHILQVNGACAFALQAGYAFGSIARSTVAATRVPRRLIRSVKATRSG
jgi:uncharacterized membrane protein YoaK (UPF0700 family)